MRLSPAKQAFVYTAFPLLLLATQIQSCSSADDPQETNLTGTGATGGGAPPPTGGTGAATMGGSGGVVGTGATGATGVGGGPTVGPTTPPNPNETTVAIVQSAMPTAAAIDQAEVNRMVGEAVALSGGLQGIVTDGMTVVVKPNLVSITEYTSPGYSGPDLLPEANGVTTDWRVTAAVVDLVEQLNPSGQILVMEGSAAPTAVAFAQLGYTQANIPNADAILAIETDSAEPNGMVTVPVAGSLLHPQYTYNTKYYNADVVITVPVLKNHWHAVITGGIKNLGIGATPAPAYGDGTMGTTRMGGATGIDHTTIALHHHIHDFYLGRPAQFVVMDGLQGCEHGPNPSVDIDARVTTLAAHQKNMRMIVAGPNSVSVDTVEGLIIGWDPMSAEYLTQLHNSGAGSMLPADIRIVGPRVSEIRTQFNGDLATFAFGGAMISDVVPPVVTLASQAVSAGVLSIALQADDTLERVEVYLNGTLVEPPIVGGYDAIALNVTAFPPGAYDLDVIGYDFYRNEALISQPGAVIIP